MKSLFLKLLLILCTTELTLDATRFFSTLLDATRRYSPLLDATRRYSTLLDATRRYLTLLDATLRYLTLLDATRCYSTLTFPNRWRKKVKTATIISFFRFPFSVFWLTLLDAIRRYSKYSTLLYAIYLIKKKADVWPFIALGQLRKFYNHLQKFQMVF
jgi:hypothetical protein